LSHDERHRRCSPSNAVANARLPPREHYRSNTHRGSRLDGCCSSKRRSQLVSHSAQVLLFRGHNVGAFRSSRLFGWTKPTLVGNQPPLRAGGIISSLLDIGLKLIPGIEFRTEVLIELLIAGLVGSTREICSARSTISVNAEPWACDYWDATRREKWPVISWPFGAWQSLQ